MAAFRTAFAKQSEQALGYTSQRMAQVVPASETSREETWEASREIESVPDPMLSDSGLNPGFQLHFYAVHRMIHPWRFTVFGVDIGAVLYRRVRNKCPSTPSASEREAFSIECNASEAKVA